VTVEPMRSLPKLRSPATESRRASRLISRLLDGAEDKGQPKIVFRKYGLVIDATHTGDGTGDLILQFGSSDPQRLSYELAMRAIEARVFEITSRIREFIAHEQRHEQRKKSAPALTLPP